MSTKYINFEDKKIKHKGAATLINISALQNCSLKKYVSEHRCTSKLLPQKIYFKTLWHDVS